MDFGFENIMDFAMAMAMNIDKIYLANFGYWWDCGWPLETYTERSNSMVFGFEKIMNFVVDIDKLNLAKELG